MLPSSTLSISLPLAAAFACLFITILMAKHHTIVSFNVLTPSPSESHTQLTPAKPLCHRYQTTATAQVANTSATWLELIANHSLVVSSADPLKPSLSCRDLMRLLSTMTCRPALFSHQHNLGVEICQAFSGSGSGILALSPRVVTTNIANDSTTHGAQRIYYIRMVGPEILAPDIIYCGGHGLAFAQYSIAQPGKYAVEVLQLYNRWAFTNPPQMNLDFRVGYFVLDVQTGTPHLCPGEACPECTPEQGCTGLPTGRWVVHNPQHPLARAINGTCFFHNKACHPMELGLLATHDAPSILQWVPYTCRLPHMPAVTSLPHNLSTDVSQLSAVAAGAAAAAELAAHPLMQANKTQLAEERLGHDRCSLPAVAQAIASSKRPVCFIGDSQLRHLHYLVVALLEGLDFRMVRGGEMRFKEAFPRPLSTHTDAVWGEQRNTSNCSAVIFNFGQWPVAWTAGKQPWTLQRYAQQVHVVARHLVVQRTQHNTPHFWVTTNPVSLMNNFRPGTPLSHDWRVEPMILAINHIATQIMHQHNVPVIDIHSLARPLAHLTLDASHYVGVVGYAQARVILTTVCQAWETQHLKRN